MVMAHDGCESVHSPSSNDRRVISVPERARTSFSVNNMPLESDRMPGARNRCQGCLTYRHGVRANPFVLLFNYSQISVYIVIYNNTLLLQIIQMNGWLISVCSRYDNTAYGSTSHNFERRHTLPPSYSSPTVGIFQLE